MGTRAVPVVPRRRNRARSLLWAAAVTLLLVGFGNMRLPAVHVERIPTARERATLQVLDEVDRAQGGARPLDAARR
ncbi:MAG TPA: hypothetical protein VNN07_15875 [Candidatus Tectomicrobia bacterium]|nr:hypothetical protein [Candidatus Tectomicrobia bacterium]